MQKYAKFNIGEQVIHINFHYRAIIIDADPLFLASGRLNPQTFKRAFATKNPWYRLLVDKSQQITYVEECFLEKDWSSIAIDNPLLKDYLCKQEIGYRSQVLCH